MRKKLSWIVLKLKGRARATPERETIILGKRLYAELRGGTAQGKDKRCGRSAIKKKWRRDFSTKTILRVQLTEKKREKAYKAD